MKKVYTLSYETGYQDQFISEKAAIKAAELSRKAHMNCSLSEKVVTVEEFRNFVKNMIH